MPEAHLFFPSLPRNLDAIATMAPSLLHAEKRKHVQSDVMGDCGGLAEFYSFTRCLLGGVVVLGFSKGWYPTADFESHIWCIEIHLSPIWWRWNHMKNMSKWHWSLGVDPRSVDPPGVLADLVDCSVTPPGHGIQIFSCLSIACGVTGCLVARGRWWIVVERSSAKCDGWVPWNPFLVKTHRMNPGIPIMDKGLALESYYEDGIGVPSILF